MCGMISDFYGRIDEYDEQRRDEDDERARAVGGPTEEMVVISSGHYVSVLRRT